MSIVEGAVQQRADRQCGNCDRLDRWRDLLDMHPSDDDLEDVGDEGGYGGPDFEIQDLRDAEGRDLNLDDYSVDVDRLPRGFDAPEEFLDHFRRSFNSFINPDQAVLRGIDQDNTAAWRRPRRAPVGSVQVFDIYDAGPGAIHEQAGVVVSRSSPTSWTFSTISVGGFSPGDHPVSGHSEFGIRPNGRGGYEVYVRAVDRVTHRMDGPLPEFPEGCIESERGVLRGGDELWRDFQRRTADYINEHGGSASVNDPTVLDPPWNSDLVQHCVSN